MSFAILDSGALNSSITDQGLIVWAVFMAILADKDKDGITTLSPKAIAKNFCHENVEEIETAWNILAAPDPASKNKEQGGRRIIPTGDGRWLVVSHEKYRSIHKQAVRREQLRQAKARQREKEKASEEAEAHGGPTPKEAAQAFKEEPAKEPEVTGTPKNVHGPPPPTKEERDAEIERLMQEGPSPPPEPMDDKWL
jgi:hypothetical protein